MPLREVVGLPRLVGVQVMRSILLLPRSNSSSTLSLSISSTDSNSNSIIRLLRLNRCKGRGRAGGRATPRMMIGLVRKLDGAEVRTGGGTD